MKKALGKGLSSLIPDSYVNNFPQIKNNAVEVQEKVEGFELIPIAEIEPNPD